MRRWDNTKGGAALRGELATARVGGESVKDNAYDDPRFSQGYRRMREDPESTDEFIEQPP